MKKLKKLKEILERIESATKASHIGWTQSDVSRYALEPVLQACGWDTADPQITRGGERNALWLHNAEGVAMVCAVARAQGASVEHAARLASEQVARGADDEGGGAGPAIQVTTNATEWRIDTTDGAIVTIGPEDGDAEQRARQLRRLIGEREIASGRAMENLVSSALERNLKPAWEALRPGEGEEETGPVAEAVLQLTEALAHAAGARSDTGVKRTREFVIAQLWPEPRARRGGRRPARLSVWRETEAGDRVKIERVMVKDVYAETLAQVERAHPGTLERLAGRYKRDIARDKETLRESVRKRARHIEGYWVECNLSAEEAEKRLREGLAGAGEGHEGWIIEVAPREGAPAE